MDRRHFLAGSLAAGVAVVAGLRLPRQWGRAVPGKLLDAGPTERQAATSTHATARATTPTDDSSSDDDVPQDLEELVEPEDTDADGLHEPASSPPQEDAVTEPLPVRSIEVICRDALGLVAAAAGGREHVIEQLTLHHTAVPLERNELAPSRLRGHQRYHQQAGWPDIAYHYAVDLAGHVYELRDPELAGDTFTDYDPAGHFLVVCEGDYDRDRPSDEMLQRVAELFASAALQHGADLHQIGGHRDYAATSCPGDHLHAQLPAIQQEASRLVARERVELASLCGAPARTLIEAIEVGRG